MPRRQQPPPPEPPVELPSLSSEQIQRGISKLKKRIEELKRLPPSSVKYNDPRIYAFERSVRNTILEIYGPRSPQYRDHQGFHIKPMSFVLQDDWREQQYFTEGHAGAIVTLESLVKELEEWLGDAATDPAARARTAFEDLGLHPRIADAAGDLFRDGHYRQAVLDACLALRNAVREKSRRDDLDGADLMNTVFSKNKPIVAFNDLADQSDLDEQQGLMHLMAGAWLALRNPRAHDLDDDSPEYALECLGLLSMLARRVDRARRVPGSTPPRVS